MAYIICFLVGFYLKHKFVLFDRWCDFVITISADDISYNIYFYLVPSWPYTRRANRHRRSKWVIIQQRIINTDIPDNIKCISSKVVSCSSRHNFAILLAVFYNYFPCPHPLYCLSVHATEMRQMMARICVAPPHVLDVCGINSGEPLANAAQTLVNIWHITPQKLKPTTYLWNGLWSSSIKTEFIHIVIWK